MTAYVTRAPAGFPGAVTRADSLTIQPEMIDSATPPTAYGAPVKLVSGKVQPLGASGAIYGLAVRAYPVQSTTNAFGAAAPPTSGLLDVMRRGYMAVALKQGTAAKGAQVYVRTVADTGKAVGDIEAGLDAIAASATKAGGNTGNGTFVLDASTPVLAGAKSGVYTLRCVTAVTNGGVFRLEDPDGIVLGDVTIPPGAGNSVTVNEQIKGVITDGSTDFAVGDGFDITVTMRTVAIPAAQFMGPADAGGVVEIAYNI
jgi:hypothetical protein